MWSSLCRMVIQNNILAGTNSGSAGSNSVFPEQTTMTAVSPWLEMAAAALAAVWPKCRMSTWPQGRAAMISLSTSTPTTMATTPGLYLPTASLGTLIFYRQGGPRKRSELTEPAHLGIKLRTTRSTAPLRSSCHQLSSKVCGQLRLS